MDVGSSRVDELRVDPIFRNIPSELSAPRKSVSRLECMCSSFSLRNPLLGFGVQTFPPVLRGTMGIFTGTATGLQNGRRAVEMLGDQRARRCIESLT